MEAIDVRDGVYTAAYGPNGEPYSIGTEGERVIIRPTGEPPQPEKLRALILPYFDFIGEKPDDNVSLASLLERCPPENIEGGPGIIAKLIIFGLPLLLIIGVIYALT